MDVGEVLIEMTFSALINCLHWSNDRSMELNRLECDDLICGLTISKGNAV